MLVAVYSNNVNIILVDFQLEYASQYLIVV